MFWTFGRANPEPPSLLRGLAKDLLLLHLAGLAVLLLVVFDRLDAVIDDLEAEDMHRDALALAERLTSHGLSAATLDSATQAHFSPDYGRYRFSVLDRDGRVLVSSLDPAQALAPLDPATPPEGVRFRAAHRAAMLWGVTVPARIGTTPVWIQVAEDMNHRDAVIDEVGARFLDQGGWLILLLSAGQIAAALLRTRRRIRPLVAASASAGAIGPDIGHQRVRAEGVPREILPLVGAVNGAFDRIEATFRAQKEFLENAAHELRTPLSVLRARVETLEDAAMRRELETDIAVLSRLVTQLLRAAEIEGLAGHDQGPVDLERVAATVASYLVPAASRAGRTIRVSAAGPARVTGSAETIGQAINNLVENALSHTPPGSAVEVEVRGGAHPQVRVRDHGPGVAPDERELVFQRFWRRDRRQGSGAGLGLAMVRRAMDLHGGSAHVEAAPGGGALFVLDFPPPSG